MKKSVNKEYWNSIYKEAWQRVKDRWSIREWITSTTLSLILGLILSVVKNYPDWLAIMQEMWISLLLFGSYVLMIFVWESGKVSPIKDKEQKDKLEAYQSPANVFLSESPEEKADGSKRWKGFLFVNNTEHNVENPYVSLEEIRNKHGDPLSIKLPVHLGWSRGNGKFISRKDKKNFDVVVADAGQNTILITSDMGDFSPLNPGTYYFDLAVGGDIEKNPFRRKRATVLVIYNGGIDVTAKIVKEWDEPL